MSNHGFMNGKLLSGYRLARMELFNWGTFDSSRGQIHILPVDGESALVVGQNGSGKSTLVDALLTLLVRPVVRNYNVAAGAHKQERDERTYVKGAFGRFSRDEDNAANVQYLRPKMNHPSILLACFRNRHTQRAFSLAQLLYLTADGDVEKLYCFSSDERTIAKDFGNLRGTERLGEQLRRRGLKTTNTYAEYHSWFAKETRVLAKAMDMFNQTVAVKDIHKLNAFIRDHMLEAKPWLKKVDSLLNHFTQLSEAHRSLVAARKQQTLLDPIAEAGENYRELESRLAAEKKLLDATDSFFRSKTVELFEPEGELRRSERAKVQSRILQADRDLAQSLEECRRLKNEIEKAGGERLRQIPLLIENHETQAQQKGEALRQFVSALRAAEVDRSVTDANELAAVRTELLELLNKLGRIAEKADAQRTVALVKRSEANGRLRADVFELEALSQRRENLPETFAELRRRLCADLRLPISDVPFSSELISVKADQAEWEASIEMVLRGFALSLLVPNRHYAAVSRYLDANRVVDAAGGGQRLVYLRVGERTSPAVGSPAPDQSLLQKLDIREGHPISPWLKAELAERFDYRCCETLEQFQSADGRAMTKNRHIKGSRTRHEKDDRERFGDPRNFVLGWDNRKKRKFLAESVGRGREVVAEFDRQLDEAATVIRRAQERQMAAHRALEVTDFSNVDPARHEQAIRNLREERRALEEGSDAIRILKNRLHDEDTRHAALGRQRDDDIGRERVLRNEIETGEQLLSNAESILKARRASGELKQQQVSFAMLEEELRGDPLTVANLFEREKAFTDGRHRVIGQLHQEIAPVTTHLQKLMAKFLQEFPSEKSDLQQDVAYLDSFLDVRMHLLQEDLPRHEERFKERLNEKVTHEIGLFNGALQSECSEIKKKIDVLNASLAQLEYRPGTYMRLEPRPVRDREIIEFQQGLKECLAGTFEGTFEADEARFVRIEKLIVRLREEQRWREKVADVRRWFDFAAREIDAISGQERAYYEDSTGQSGGEKAKLAFTILVAAIAYQYDIAPGQPASNRFHFVVIDEMFSKVDDQYAEYALELFRKFNLQLLIVAPLDAKARVTEPYVGCYLHIVKDNASSHSQILSMTAREFEHFVEGAKQSGRSDADEILGGAMK